ncbi:hypothetical protein [Brevundimonas sp.]|uniref:hypothetical protein n=1 Tax=Brevundimonas sp. TaxID=1871086 RepID=UPI002D46D8A9|nr:hypothetical protein [Brevundimonas sp.]HYC69268.1 hypothetical protein [Brevundimonas sp.]
MRNRPPSPMRLKAALLYEVQRARLEKIRRGEIEPLYDREFYYLWTWRDGRRPKYADFILPPLLFLAEQELHGGGDAPTAEAEASGALSAS